MRSFIVTVFLIQTSSLWALTPPLSLPSAQVLPKGVRSVSYKGALAEGTHQYNNEGRREVLADPFNTSLDFKTIKEGTLDPQDLATIQSKMDKLGVSDQDSFGLTTGQVNVDVRANVPVLAYGLSDRITLAVAAPITEYSLNVDTGVLQSNRELYDLFRAELQNSGVSVKLRELDEQLADPVNYKLNDYGYKRLTNERETKLGDMRFVAKYKAYESIEHVLTFTPEVTAPTGKERDPDKIIDLGAGDGQWDVGLGVNYDYRANENWTFSFEAGHLVQFSDTREERIPEQFDSSISPDKENVSRDLGDESRVIVALAWQRGGWSLASSYALQHKEKDRFTGEQFSRQRYRWLEYETNGNMQSLQAYLGYDTIGLYQQGKFAVPLSLQLGHSRVLAGKNVVINPMTTLDFSLYF